MQKVTPAPYQQHALPRTTSKITAPKFPSREQLAGCHLALLANCREPPLPTRQNISTRGPPPPSTKPQRHVCQELLLCPSKQIDSAASSALLMLDKASEIHSSTFSQLTQRVGIGLENSDHPAEQVGLHAHCVAPARGAHGMAVRSHHRRSCRSKTPVSTRERAHPGSLQA